MAVQLRHIREPTIAASSPDLILAVATFRRGTGFLGAGLRVPSAAHRPAAILPSDSKVLGNGLREIDRFLSLLIDAVADALALCPVTRTSLARQHNTARKLATLRTAMALANPDDAALRAIGRSRACLFHTGGIVRAGSPRSMPTRGWADPDERRDDQPATGLAIGSPLPVSALDLHRIGQFYDRIATDLLAALEIKGIVD